MNSNELRITFFGGVGTVTGANFLLEVPNKQSGEVRRIIIDCGLFQGTQQHHDQNREKFPYDPASIDEVVITHAHADHIGRLPRLVREGFTGPIFSTPVTKEISALMLEDTARILSYQAEETGRDPLYTQKDVERTLAQWKTEPYHTPFSLGDASVRFLDAGHILGSSIIEITVEDTKIAFTGDLGNSPAPLLRDTEAIKDVDYLIMESVYGDRNHENRDARKDMLKKTILRTIEQNGVLMIPVFSVERTQELLYEINDLAESKQIPKVPIFLDSPLAIKVTEIYASHSENFDQETKARIKHGDDVFSFPGLQFTETKEESKRINGFPPPKIILAGSGMSTGGRILYHEKRYLSDPNNTLLIVGYQAAGTLGRAIQEGARTVVIDNEEIPVRARIETITGYSGHKGADELVEFVAGARDQLRRIYCVMGEPKSSTFLAQRLRDYVGVDARVPNVGETVTLPLD